MSKIRTLLDNLGFDVLRSSSKFSLNESGQQIRKYKEFPNIGILDTSIGSYNLGDFIIMESVYKAINASFDYKAYFTSFPTHLHIAGDDRKKLSDKELLFVGGTNLLNVENIRAQWKIRPTDLKYYKNRCVLLGVGSSSYSRKPSEETKSILKTILSDTYMHSVRDEYTKELLHSIGITNVINTCCPTTWNLKPNAINWQVKQRLAVTTITDYSEDIVNDGLMLRNLLANYEAVHIWIQSIRDITYLDKLLAGKKYDNLFLISPSLEAYRHFLDENAANLDYVGTRLHAGIFAMQRNIRSLIIGIDNRATEIAKDINLNVIDRNNINEMLAFINHPSEHQLRLPTENIDLWKNQFVSL